ncbi:hypothetical protein GCM10010448_07010 [Streptomyces glomeratus]|uniref:Uncharacterized protein n=1 Tax=Streptomyces glomeratus TaxID=284452 RepID=A0ABP6L262_9ACTN
MRGCHLDSVTTRPFTDFHPHPDTAPMWRRDRAEGCSHTATRRGFCVTPASHPAAGLPPGHDTVDVLGEPAGR